MNREFLRTEILGNLNIDDILIDDEDFQVFTCSNELGQVYLCLLPYMGVKRWLLTPLSPERLQFIACNMLTVREAFIGAEDGLVWNIDGNSICNPLNVYHPIGVYRIKVEDIPLDDLPEEVLFLL